MDRRTSILSSLFWLLLLGVIPGASAQILSDEEVENATDATPTRINVPHESTIIGQSAESEFLCNEKLNSIRNTLPANTIVISNPSSTCVWLDDVWRGFVQTKTAEIDRYYVGVSPWGVNGQPVTDFGFSLHDTPFKACEAVFDSIEEHFCEPQHGEEACDNSQNDQFRFFDSSVGAYGACRTWEGTLNPSYYYYDVRRNYEVTLTENHLRYRYRDESFQKTSECPAQPPTKKGNPIDFREGVKYETKLDYIGAGPFPLKVSRTYTSDNEASELWRFGFSDSLGRSLEFPGNEPDTVWLRQADGSVLTFRSLDGGISYTPDSDVVLRLTVVTEGWELVDKNDRTEIFGSDGMVQSVTLKSGLTHSYQYDSGMVTISDDFGRSLVVEHIDGEIQKVTLPDGNHIDYRYDYYDRLEFVEFSNGEIIQYHYRSNQDLLTGVTDERGIRYATFGYDFDGRATLTEHAGGVDRYSFVYNGYQSTVTNPLGKVTEHVFEDIQGSRKLKTSDRLDSPHCGASSSAYTYDANGFIDTKTDWEGNVTSYTRDHRGLALSTTTATGTSDERTVTTQWHSDFRLPEVMTEPGRTTTYTYSPYDNPNYTQKTVTDLTTGESRTWNYSYNQYGQVLTIDGPRSDVIDTLTYTYRDCATGSQCGQIHTLTNGLGHVTTYNSYDANGYPTQITDANGIITTLGYDQRQRPTFVTIDGHTTTMTYDPTGNVERVTLADGTYTEYVRDDANRLVALFDGQGNRIDWTLDNAGNRTNEQIKDPSGLIRKSLQTQYDELSRVRGMVYAHGGTSSYVYDNNGNQTQRTDADNRVSHSEYDALDRVIKDIDAIAGETIYTYDDRDNLTTVTDPEGLTTTYIYNGFDEVVSEQSPDTGTTSYTYDSAGNRATQTDARGITATYTYDALNRLIQTSYPDSSENITYSYDQGTNGVGRLTQITDASGTTDYGYDARGNTTSVTQTVGGQSYTQTYTYNGANRLTGMTYPSGRTVTYIHDTSGRVNQISSVGNEGAETLADTIARLPFGPVSSLTLGNGIERTRSYDQDYRVENLTDGAVLAKGLAYSAVNNITAITDTVDTDLSQLFTYDDLDRLDFATGNYGEDTYSYDGIGNRLSFTRDTQSESYTYNSGSHRLQRVAGQSYQYDAAGNTLSGGAKSYTYNNRNRLVSATASGITTDYQHNALGQRVIKGSGTDQTHFVYDLEGRLIAEARGGTVTVEYAYLDGEPLVMWRDAPVELDTDGDGIPDTTDPDDDNDGQSDVDENACGSDPLDSLSLSTDTDGDASPDCIDTDDDDDGVEDAFDAFPLDATESSDNDSDGIGDNADLDDDNDGVEDTLDAFPFDATETTDTDGDGTGNNADPDDDNDGVEDGSDAFPLDPGESADNDADGIGDNADTDDDNDGVEDINDAFPFDASESNDNDADGIGDNADPDDDNDGVDDINDPFPFDSGENSDADGDGIGDNADTDDDNDGVEDTLDAFPFDPTEKTDTDGDGTGNNADLDDDNDGQSDIDENACGSDPLDAASLAADTDSDNMPDCADSDDDNDGVEDSVDAFPLDAGESVDTDGDGIGNNADMDDDNDGQSDADEIACGADPLDATSQCVSAVTLSCDGYEITEVSVGVFAAPGFSGTVIVGTAGADVLEGTSGADLIVGRRGADTIRGRGGDDVICGGAGQDDIEGNGGNDSIRGGKGMDLISGGLGDDTINGGNGADELRGNEGNDTIAGGKGNDEIRGGKNQDTLSGGKNDDEIYGGNGNDTLKGGSGVDYCEGGSGSGDSISGCEGASAP